MPMTIIYFSFILLAYLTAFYYIYLNLLFFSSQNNSVLKWYLFIKELKNITMKIDENNLENNRFPYNEETHRNEVSRYQNKNAPQNFSMGTTLIAWLALIISLVALVLTLWDKSQKFNAIQPIDKFQQEGSQSDELSLKMENLKQEISNNQNYDQVLSEIKKIRIEIQKSINSSSPQVQSQLNLADKDLAQIEEQLKIRNPDAMNSLQKIIDKIQSFLKK